MPRIADLNAVDFRSLIRPGDLICWGQASAEPVALTSRLMEQRSAIGPFRVFIGVSLTDTPNPIYADQVSFSSFCGTGTNRRLAAAGKLDILPLHYSDLPSALASMVDVLFLQLAVHPEDGTYSLSAACDYVQTLIKTARLVVAEVNRQAPFTDAVVEPNSIDLIVRTDRPLPEIATPTASAIDRRIAANVTELIDDGATLQFGLGSLPECVADMLSDHRDLGLHTGLMSDGAMRLMEGGAITNAHKPFDRGISVAGALLGTRRLQAFTHLNPAIGLRPISYTHSLRRLAALPRFTAINSAIQVDLSGQANTETASGRYVGAVGGAVDFVRGARASEGGTPIIALSSTARVNGTCQSRIVPQLTEPATIGRADIGVVVTEHGVADLRGLSLEERGRKLISVADPQFREELERSLREALF